MYHLLNSLQNQYSKHYSYFHRNKSAPEKCVNIIENKTEYILGMLLFKIYPTNSYIKNKLSVLQNATS